MSLLVGEKTRQYEAYCQAACAFREVYWRRKKSRRIAQRFGLPRNDKLEAAVCNARHAMMEALRELEEENVSALLQKARYMNVAKLPRGLHFDDVLYYVWGRTIHLFYGGEGAPDGPGHGHAVLLTYRGTPKYGSIYHRKPYG